MTDTNTVPNSRTKRFSDPPEEYIRLQELVSPEIAEAMFAIIAYGYSADHVMRFPGLQLRMGRRKARAVRKLLIRSEKEIRYAQAHMQAAASLN